MIDLESLTHPQRVNLAERRNQEAVFGIERLDGKPPHPDLTDLLVTRIGKLCYEGTEVADGVWQRDLVIDREVDPVLHLTASPDKPFDPSADEAGNTIVTVTNVLHVVKLGKPKGQPIGYYDTTESLFAARIDPKTTRAKVLKRSTSPGFLGGRVGASHREATKQASGDDITGTLAMILKAAKREEQRQILASQVPQSYA